MKLEDARAAYYEYSGKASDIARTLALGGIAVVWVFKTDTKLGPQLSTELVLPILLLVCSLTLDLLHYLVATVTWGTYHRIKECEGLTKSAEFQAPPWLNWPTTFVLFPAKLIALGGAYGLLLRFLWHRLWMHTA
jgi:hypothetical protein